VILGVSANTLLPMQIQAEYHLPFTLLVIQTIRFVIVWGLGKKKMMGKEYMEFGELPI